MLKKCVLVSIMLHMVLIIGAGLYSPHPSAQVKPRYFQLISVEIPEKRGTAGQSILSGQATSYSTSAPKTIQAQQSEIPKIFEIKDASYDTGGNRSQLQDATSNIVADISIANGSQGSSGVANQSEGSMGTAGDGLGGAGNWAGKSNIQQAKIKKDYKPTYPEEARKKGWEGVVRLEAVISKDGRVEKVTVMQSSGYQLLDDEAIRAVKKRRYQPAVQNGKPIESIRQIPIRFKLED
jgi:TonB family protein